MVRAAAVRHVCIQVGSHTAVQYTTGSPALQQQPPRLAQTSAVRGCYCGQPVTPPLPPAPSRPRQRQQRARGSIGSPCSTATPSSSGPPRGDYRNHYCFRHHFQPGNSGSGGATLKQFTATRPARASRPGWRAESGHHPGIATMTKSPGELQWTPRICVSNIGLVPLARETLLPTFTRCCLNPR